MNELPNRYSSGELSQQNLNRKKKKSGRCFATSFNCTLIEQGNGIIKKDMLVRVLSQTFTLKAQTFLLSASPISFDFNIRMYTFHDTAGITRIFQFVLSNIFR